MQCTENLKQIGLAMQGYHQKYGCFPPAFVPDQNGKPKHSWRVLILPFLQEQKYQNLYAKYRFDEPWNSPHNMALADDMPRVYRCPTDDSTDLLQTSYAMIVGPHAISDGASSRRLDEIKDRGAGTIMVADVSNAGIKWLEPRDLGVQEMIPILDFVQRDLRVPALESPHSVVNVLFCDGTVHAVDKSVDETARNAMLTADGSETVPAR